MGMETRRSQIEERRVRDAQRKKSNWRKQARDDCWIAVKRSGCAAPGSAKNAKNGSKKQIENKYVGL